MEKPSCASEASTSQENNSTRTTPTVSGCNNNKKSVMQSVNKINDSIGGGNNNEEKVAEFEFEPPPEGPVFRPSAEEFEDPLAYIRKIRPDAEPYGICKIIPPKDWCPPFAVNVDKLSFIPRVQRLNELDAGTRVKLNFLDQIAKFWELQGSTLKIPTVERRSIDLYVLHNVVRSHGGFKQVTNDRKWSRVAIDMGYTPGKGTIGFILKGHYERLLFPYDLFKAGKTLSPQKGEDVSQAETVDQSSVDVKVTDKSYTPHEIVGRMAMRPPQERCARRSKRFRPNQTDEETKEDKPDVKVLAAIKKEAKVNVAAVVQQESPDKKANSNEVKRLKFYGAGPKMSLTKSRECKKLYSPNTPKKKVDPLAKYICLNCNRGDAEESMLLCDGCDDSFHTFCLIPKLNEIPKGDWRCPRCVAEEVSKPVEAFGFEQAHREYTLQQFGEMADQFKQEYFNMPINTVPKSTVEKEFWRIVSSLDEDVTVEYGADLHTMDHGSGFPTRTSLNLQSCDEPYVNSPWNLNNLPVLEDSVLGYIDADISGMKVPWMYVGMCFSTFCWHNEDHWSYSINYLHWGEAKTWYGVPGGRAEDFELTMKAAAPELFQSQPDLLHQLVTIMNPNILMKVGVPVYRTDQEAGEFVITFPRSYHAGFNQGYNFAEAVNFAPADWLSTGRDCISHYASLRRYCVFSHDELICKMSSCADRLSLNLAEAVYQDMLRMIEVEAKLRRQILNKGIQNTEREAFEALADDARQCEECKTTCFLSALKCACRPDILVCSRHYDKLCLCQPKCDPNSYTFMFRYTLVELPNMLNQLKNRVGYFEIWIDQVREALGADGTKKLMYDELRSLFDEALQRRLPKCELLDNLKEAVKHAENCNDIAEKIIKMMSSRLRYQQQNKLTIRELMEFNVELNKLPCHSPHADTIHDLVQQTERFLCESEEHLGQNLSEVSVDKLKTSIASAEDSMVSFPNVPKLKSKYEQAVWLNRALTWLGDDHLTMTDIKATVMAGERFPSNPEIENQLNKFRTLVKKGEEWETTVTGILTGDQTVTVDDIEALLDEAEELHYILPSEDKLREALGRAAKWLKELNKINSYEHYPYLEEVEELHVKGQKLAVKLNEVAQLHGSISEAKKWKNQVTQMFLYDQASLMDAISPRVKDDHDIFNLTSDMNNEVVTQLFKKAEACELKSMRGHRSANQSKNRDKASFCTCSKSWRGPMVQCELCKDRFHENCVKKPKYKIKARRRFLCRDCHRTRRPYLESVTPVLMAYDNMRVKFPEGQALQYLTERAMAWQEKAKALLEAGTITDNRRMKLCEELLMEGDLLEVAVPETNLLWERLEDYPDRKSTATDFDASPSKRRCSRPAGGFTSPKRARIWRKLNSSLEVEEEQDEEEEMEVEEVEEEEEEEEESEEEPDEEQCAAAKCLPPPSNRKKVSWIQCDGDCNKWFHMHCVGVKANELDKNDDYFCKVCTKKSGV